MSKIKVTLEMDCSSVLEFENNLDMDENFDLVDSIISLLDYGGEDSYGYETLHNKIKIKVNKGYTKLPYKIKGEDDE